MAITNPTDIANCECWYKRGGWYTDAGITLATNSQSVQQWTDASGHGRHASQTTAAKKPVRNNAQYQGLDGLRFTRANLSDLAFDMSWATNTAATLYIITRRASDLGGSTNDFYLGTATGGTSLASMAFGYLSPRLYHSLWTPDVSGDIGSFAPGEPAQRDCFRWGGPGGGVLSRDITRNGISIFSSTTDTARQNNATFAADSRIGEADGTRFNGWFDGWIFEIVGYSRLLTTGEVADLETWADGQGYFPPPPITNDLVTAGFLSAGQAIAIPNPADRVTAAFLSAGQTIAAPGAPPINARVTAGFASAGQVIAAPVPVDNDRVTAGWLSVGQVIAVPVVGKPYSYAFIIS